MSLINNDLNRFHANLPWPVGRVAKTQIFNQHELQCMKRKIPKESMKATLWASNKLLHNFHHLIQVTRIDFIKVIQYIAVNIQDQCNFTILKCRQNNF